LGKVLAVPTHVQKLNLIFTTKFIDSSFLITIMSWDYFNLSLATSQCQPRLLSITSVASGGLANQIAVFTSN